MKAGTLLAGRASARHSSRHRWPARRPRESVSFVGLKPDLRKALPLLCLTLAACSSLPQENRSFSCKGGTIFQVAGGGDSITLTLNGRNHQLACVHSGSGEKYTDRRLLFWDKGDGNAILASSTHGLVRCQAQ